MILGDILVVVRMFIFLNCINYLMSAIDRVWLTFICNTHSKVDSNVEAGKWQM